VLTAADTNTYLANSGLVYIKQQTVGTTVSSVTVSDAFSTTYDNYRIIYAGGVMSAQERFKVTLGASVASYYSSVTFVTYSTGNFGSAGSNNSAAWNFIGGGSTSSGGFVMDLQNPFLAQYTQMNGFGSLQTEQSTNAQGIHAVASSYTSFIVSPANGTITGGIITVFGYRKS
jgi:hypothetical protein